MQSHFMICEMNDYWTSLMNMCTVFAVLLLPIASAEIRTSVFNMNFQVNGMKITSEDLQAVTLGDCAVACLVQERVSFSVTHNGAGEHYCSLTSNKDDLPASHIWDIYYRQRTQCQAPLPESSIPLVKRRDGNIDFNRNWADYKAGFGDPDSNYWIGLDTLHTLTSSATYRLRVDMMDWEGNCYWAEYNNFSVGPESDNYRLNISGYDFSSSAGDALSYHNNMMFSTFDRDNDASFNACAVIYPGGWWYNTCHLTNPNGIYVYEGGVVLQGITWYQVYYNFYSFQYMSYSLIQTA